MFPNQKRLDGFLSDTGRTGPTELVWNVPAAEEVGPTKPRPNPELPLKLFYGGSLSPERLPWLVLEEIWRLKGRVNLDIIGYPNYENRRFPAEIKSKDGNCGIVRYQGAVPRRQDLFRVMDVCEAALCLMPSKSLYSGMEQMAGASNKPFDAMARGLAVVVSDLPHWTELYLEEHTKEAVGGRREAGRKLGTCLSKEVFRVPGPGKGYGIAINPESRESIRAGLEWMLANRGKLWEMGEHGRQRIQKQWNYERLYEPILETLLK